MLVEFEILGIQLKESWISTMIGIFQIPLTKNPESSTWNPEFTAWNTDGQSGSLYVSGKLPTYPSPEPTLILTTHLGKNVGLGEG